MNPEEKANELYNKMLQWQTDSNIYIERKIISINAKKSALIAVEEIIKERYFHNEHYKQNSKLKYHIEIELAERLEATRNYWNEVKHEIEQL